MWWFAYNLKELENNIYIDWLKCHVLKYIHSNYISRMDSQNVIGNMYLSLIYELDWPI